jgi:uncharacterized membrane protein
LFAGAVIIIIALIALFHTPVDHQMRRWKLLPEPERLTELYFTHPNNLPTNYTPGQPLPVAFTVHNLEYRTTTYHYQITEQAQDGSTSQTLTTGTFTLPQNQYKPTALNISLIDLGQHVKVLVMLEGQNESIDYLLSKEGA